MRSWIVSTSYQVENWCNFDTELSPFHWGVCFEDLTDVHTRDDTERVEDDIDWLTIRCVRYIFWWDDTSDDTLVTVDPPSYHRLRFYEFVPRRLLPVENSCCEIISSSFGESGHRWLFRLILMGYREKSLWRLWFITEDSTEETLFWRVLVRLLVWSYRRGYHHLGQKHRYG